MTEDMRGTASKAELSAAVIERAEDVATVLADLSDLLGKNDVGSALQHVVDIARRTVPDCDAAGVTLLQRGRPATAAYTDERTLEVDSAQYDQGDGPCLEAARTGTVQRVVVEEAEERWPHFADAARKAGIKSFLAAPLVVSVECVGALNLYSDSPHGFGALDEAFVALFTGQVSGAMASIQRYDQCRQLAGNLRIALDSRAVIEQAKGILIATRRLTPDAGFEFLREESQRRNIKLRLVAEEVVRATLDAAKI